MYSITYICFKNTTMVMLRLSRWHSGKESACRCRRCKRCGFEPRVRKIPWSRTWQPTPVFLPGKSHRQRSLVGCSPWGRKESDTTEQLHFHFSLHALEKEMATHSSVLAWRIPGMAEPVGLPSMGLHRVGQD